MFRKKSKYDRRRALDCKLVEKSKKNAGYYKYMVTIGEKDGTTHKQPAYGRDMQDALSRLINTERTVKVEKKLETNMFWVFLIWVIVMGWPAVVADHQTPWFLAYSFASVLLMFIGAAAWYNYLSKNIII